MKGPLAQLMRQAQAAQETMNRIQQELAQTEMTGEAGAGMVKVTMNGKHQCKRVEIDSEALKEDKEFLEDLVAAAINDVSQRLERHAAEKMQKAAGTLNLPGGLNLG